LEFIFLLNSKKYRYELQEIIDCVVVAFGRRDWIGQLQQ
jgi:hypothetical protein